MPSSPSCLPIQAANLRRALALSIALLIGQSVAAQIIDTPTTVAAPVFLAANDAALPEAPSALLAESTSAEAAQFSNPTPSSTQVSAPLPQAVIVNGRPYRKPTAHDNFVAYRREVFGPRAFISAGFRSGIEQIRGVPIGWGQDFPGYIQRYGSAYGEAAIDSSVRFGLAAAFHEDTRYLICHKCSAGDKIENAFLSEFTARHGEDGHRTFSATPIIASFSGPLVAYDAWYPPGYSYTSTQALKHATLGFSTRIIFKLVREFAFDRDKP